VDIDVPKDLKPGRRYLLPAVGAVVLLVIVAALMPEGLGWLRGRGNGDSGPVVPDPPPVFGYLVVALVIVSMAWFFVVRASFAPKTVRRPRSSPWPTVITIALLLALWMSSPDLRDWIRERFGPESVEETAPNSDEDGSAGDAGERSQALGWLMTVAILGAIGAVGWSGYMLVRRDAMETGTGDDNRGELVDAIDAGIDDLGTIADPRAAVIACYARMQALVERAGVPRRESDAPQELLERMVERYGALGPGAERLTELFEHAKFSDRPVQETDRAEAIAALTEIKQHLEVPA
jgi:Domain of unknown function (DUF4129)